MRFEVAAGLVALGVAAAAALWFTGRPPEAPPILVAPTEQIARTVTVDVSGEVRQPGLVVLQPGSRVADAIAAAGGANTDADLTALNLAAALVDGQQVTVPKIGETVPSSGLVRLNAATAAELEELPGVGPVLAERIVSFREENGPFTVAEDLLDVPGVGEAKLAALRDLITLP